MFVPLSMIVPHWAIIVLRVRLTLSTGLHCGVLTGAHRCCIPNAWLIFLIWFDRNCVPLSKMIVSGHPCRYTISSKKPCATAVTVAFLRGHTPSHLVNLSCIVNTQAHLFVDRGRGPIKLSDTCFHGWRTAVACSVPAGCICAALCAKQLAHFRTYRAISLNGPVIEVSYPTNGFGHPEVLRRYVIVVSS